MHERYMNGKIKEIFSDEHKLLLWQKTELAVIKAKVNLGLIGSDIFQTIEKTWLNQPIDIAWWKERDREIHHDLNAFIDERLRFLSPELHRYVHEKITSYDTEESAFIRMLIEALEIIDIIYGDLKQTLRTFAITYRYTIMNARTHGQEAELQTLGARALTWHEDLESSYATLTAARENLKFSKLSGAIGKYGSISPKVEKETLSILGFSPYYGSTQIMPRVLYAPIANALCGLTLVTDKIANDIRLAARSGNPLMQEPFKKKQKGSSAMPQKKNTIRTEGIEGNGIMAKGYALMLTSCIPTWEERAIAQSRVERVAWPDLFHVVADALKTLNGVLSGLKVYPDNMLKEIYESRGVYAASEAKEFLKQHMCGEKYGLIHEDIYRIVQLACFNVFEPTVEKMKIRTSVPSSPEESSQVLKDASALLRKGSLVVSIEEFIPLGALRVSGDLDISTEQVEKYNNALKDLFSFNKVGYIEIMLKWHKLFSPNFLLKNEDVLYRKILGE